MCPLQKPIFLFTRGNIFLRQLDSEYRVLAVRRQIWDSLNYEAAGACLDKREFFSVFQQANGADFAVDAGNDRLATVRPAKNMQIQTVFFAVHSPTIDLIDSGAAAVAYTDAPFVRSH